MTEALTITNTSGTINLMSATSQYASGYFSDYLPSIGEGRDPESVTTDSFPMFVNGTSRADLATKLNALQQTFEQAQRWQDSRSGPRTFVNWTPEGYAAGRRSEIVAGNYYLASGFKTEFSKTTGHRALIDVQLTRRNWWEGAQATASLTSLNADYKMYNNGDFSGTAPTKKVNYLDIDGASIAGDLPAPIRVHVIPYNFEGTTNISEWLYLNCAYSAARGYVADKEYNWHEAFQLDRGGTLISDTGYSNDNYSSYVTLTANEHLYFDQTISPYIVTFGNDVGNYHVYVKMSVGTPGTYKVTPFISDLTTHKYGVGQYLALTTTQQIVDMGVITWPPGHSEFLSPTTTLLLGMKFDTAGITLNVDYGHIMRSDKSQKYFSDKGIYSGIVDDQIDGNMAAYTATFADVKMGLTKIGKSIMLMPGKWHRIYMHTSSLGLGAELAKNVHIIPTIYYRPRYLCL